MPSRWRAPLTAQLRTHQVGLSIALLVAWTEETAWRLRGDAGYDLKNYHLYGPFALLHGKWGRDLAPAQAQGFLPPTNDLFYYLLARHIGDVHWLNLALALPTCGALALAFLITRRLVGPGVTEGLVALAAVAISATGAATHPVLATSMSDMIPCALVLGAVLRLMPGSPARHRPATAGALTGTAVALKLTLATAVPGFVAALLVQRGRPATRLGQVAVLCVALALSALLVDGWWWWRLWRFSGNPMFPLFNHVFRSPLAPASSFVDMRYFPRNVLQWLFYPMFWAVDRTPLVTEPDQWMRDPRIALGLLASLALVFRPQHAPTAAASRFLGVFLLVSYAAWEWEFSIFRYLSVVELLSATPVAVLALQAARGETSRRVVLLLSILALHELHAYTVTPNWGRLPQAGGKPFPIDVAAVPSDALVLILDPSPLSYVAVFEPDGARFFGVNNNVTRPGEDNPLQARIRAAIVRQTAHLYGLETVGFGGHDADDALAAYGLRRSSCRRVTGAIVGGDVAMCALRRVEPAKVRGIG